MNYKAVFFCVFQEITKKKKGRKVVGKKIKTAVLGIVIGFANGIFGSGGGSIAVPFMERLLDIKAHKAHATAIAIILPLSVISGFIYFWKVDILWKEALLVSLGGIFGGYIGARLLSKISGRWLHIIFGVFMIFAAVNMIK
ncbi:MAG: sulfite exporter TauE/SafE family protein [Lachnospiraceae bacterium]|nr:sulfite exporter TauE/SafE family protein [Lachnospiraceae bacterium]